MGDLAVPRRPVHTHIVLYVGDARVGAKASIVYFHGDAPNAQCAQVKLCARPSSSASLICG
eukprot:5000758-Pleurochrysis_carterae.AAC.1